MFWCDQLVEKTEGRQTINGSKTPSDRAHVGALRGPLIHDAIFRSLKAKGVSARYLFGCDDGNPVDEIPHRERFILNTPVKMVSSSPPSVWTTQIH